MGLGLCQTGTITDANSIGTSTETSFTSTISNTLTETDSTTGTETDSITGTSGSMAQES